MIIDGVGVDVVDLKRFERLVGDGRRTLRRRWFTLAEQAGCDAAASPAARYAQVFAAKEAVFKALALPHWDGSVPWAWIEVGIVPESGTMATVALTGPVAAAAGNDVRLAVSAVVTARVAFAQAIAYRGVTAMGR